MNKVINRRNALLALAAIVVLPVTWWISAGLRGRLMARYDLARGHYRVLAYGLPPPGVVEYRQLLRELYGVEYRQVALCIVSPSLISYADAYDGVSAAAMRTFSVAMTLASSMKMLAGRRPWCASMS